ncbi:fluoride efflux transporter FluC [Nitrosopumilus piranensis]|nr:CrcB family protein [Nitrosopumilus piranensis]
MSTEHWKYVDMIKIIELIFLAIGGAAGAILRFKLIESELMFGFLPISILVANIVGSFVLGAFMIISNQWHLDSRYTFLVAFGFCGSLTTMSAFALDSTTMLQQSHIGFAMINILLNVSLSLGSIFAGKTIFSMIIES